MDSQIGKIYAHQCEDDSNYYRTVRISRNFATGHLQTNVSNPIYGEIPDGLDPLPPLMRNKLLSCNNVLPYTY